MWHTLTNHPSHQQGGADHSPDGGKKQDDGKKQDKSGNETKKPDSTSS